MEMFTSVTKEDMQRVIKACFKNAKVSHLFSILSDIIEVYDDDKYYTLPEMLTQGRQDGYLTCVGMMKYTPYVYPLFELTCICQDMTDPEKMLKIYNKVVAPANGFQTLKDMFDRVPLPQKGYNLYRLRKIEEIKRGEK